MLEVNFKMLEVNLCFTFRKNLHIMPAIAFVYLFFRRELMFKKFIFSLATFIPYFGNMFGYNGITSVDSSEIMEYSSSISAQENNEVFLLNFGANRRPHSVFKDNDYRKRIKKNENEFFPLLNIPNEHDDKIIITSNEIENTATQSFGKNRIEEYKGDFFGGSSDGDDESDSSLIEKKTTKENKSEDELRNEISSSFKKIHISGEDNVEEDLSEGPILPPLTFPAEFEDDCIFPAEKNESGWSLFDSSSEPDEEDSSFREKEDVNKEDEKEDEFLLGSF